MRPTAFLPLLLLAGCACPFTKGMKHPQLAPEKGNYKVPAGTLGDMPVKPWSDTTVEAAVPDKAKVPTPLPGKIVTVTGEIIDVSCYFQLGKHGAAHKDCGQKCARNGNPLGLLARDGSVYILMAEEHHPRRDGKTDSLRDALIEQMAHIVKVTGTLSRVNGARALFVSGFAK